MPTASERNKEMLKYMEDHLAKHSSELKKHIEGKKHRDALLANQLTNDDKAIGRVAELASGYQGNAGAWEKHIEGKKHRDALLANQLTNDDKVMLQDTLKRITKEGA